jgi:hypothetical protein
MGMLFLCQYGKYGNDKMNKDRLSNWAKMVCSGRNANVLIMAQGSKHKENKIISRGGPACPPGI